MATSKKLKHSSSHDDAAIPMENIGPREHYERNPQRQGSLPSNGLHRRTSSRMETWEADLREQLPSRQATSGTIKLNRTLRRKTTARPGFGTMRLPHGQGLEDLDTEEIVENLMSNSDFADGPALLQTEDIKGLHTNLARKLSIQAKIRENADRKTQRHITWSKQVRYNTSLIWKRFRTDMAEVSYSFDLWRGHLKKIEGKFGSGVASYFSFMKWLVLLNIPVFIILFSFITIPQLLYRTQQDPAYNHSQAFIGVEIVTGEGWFKETELYYGTHYNGTIERISELYYNMPLAYMLTIAAYYVVTVFALLYSLTKSYKKNFIDASNVLQFQSVTRVLCGWDYAITALQAADLKQQSIHKELQEYLSVFRKSTVKRTDCQECGMVMLRITINLIVLGLIGGAGYLIRYVSESLRVERNEFYGLEQLALPAVISAVIFILPLAFSILIDLEKYENPQVTLYLTMARTVVLFIVSLGVIIQYWFANVHCPSPTDISDVRRALDQDATCSQCWENFLGYNMYRLVVVDFLVTLIITFFTEFVRRLIAQYCFKALGYPEFDIGLNTLYLIYSQTLIWIAVYYSPLLPFIVIIKLILLFYVKRFSVMNNCKPSVKPWRGGRAHTIFMCVLGLALILCFIAVGYSIVRLTPSVTCGPFKGRENAYSVIQEFFDEWSKKEKTFSTILQFITSTGFLAGVILGLLTAAYYARIRAHGLDEKVTALKDQIALEGKDKKFLIKLIQSAGPRPVSDHRGPYTRNPNYSNLATSPDDDLELEGGKTFAKTTMAAAAASPHDNPYESVRSSGAGGDGPGAPPGTSPGTLPTRRTMKPPQRVTSPPHDSYNEGFVDKSWDPDDVALEAAAPGHNPVYDDRSLSNRPNLPYPGRHYDMYKGGS